MFVLFFSRQCHFSQCLLNHILTSNALQPFESLEPLLTVLSMLHRKGRKVTEVQFEVMCVHIFVCASIPQSICYRDFYSTNCIHKDICMYVTLFQVSTIPHQTTSSCAKTQILQSGTVNCVTLVHPSIFHINLTLIFRVFQFSSHRNFPVELQISL